MLNSISFFYFKHLFIKFLKNYNFETLNKNLNSVEDLIALICKGKVEFKEEAWEVVSSKAQDLVIQCLTLEPTIRITASRALEHPWIVRVFAV